MYKVGDILILSSLPSDRKLTDVSMINKIIAVVTRSPGGYGHRAHQHYDLEVTYIIFLKNGRIDTVSNWGVYIDDVKPTPLDQNKKSNFRWRKA